MPKVIFMGVKATLPKGWVQKLHQGGVVGGPVAGPAARGQPADWKGNGWTELWVEYKGGDAHELVERVLMLLGLTKPPPSPFASPRLTPFRWTDPTWVEPSAIIPSA